MTHSSAIFAVLQSSLEDAAKITGDTLAIPLTRGDSEFLGGYYYRGRINQHIEVIIRLNVDLHTPEFGMEEPAEPDFEEYEFLLYASSTSSISEVVERLTAHPDKFKLLRQR